MKNIYLFIITISTVFSLELTAQTTVYSENFNNGCASNCLATTYGGWTVVDNSGGVTGGAPNNWFVSCAEEGITPPGCGSSCIGDASLHIGADPGAGGDMGASYNETGATNATFRMAVSPTINTSTYSGLTLSFDFIAFGSAACSDDRAQLRLSTDNGATWPVGFQYCLTSVCCGACNGYSQGQWTTYTLVLPAGFDNNPNVRVGFHWRNNGNGSGTDPSVAIDDIRITAPTPLSLDLLSFEADKKTNGTEVVWKAQKEKDFSHYELERSKDGIIYEKIYTRNGYCTGTEACNYSYLDIQHSELVFYRLKMIDKNGKFTYSKVISLEPSTANSSLYSLISSSIIENNLIIKLNSKKKTTADLVIYSVSGNALISKKDLVIKEGVNQLNTDVDKLAKGVYIYKLYFNDEKVLSGKIFK
ncbi:MAG: T9SS type A sorting domain-containing protein [Fluviicola sp.]|jgi:hypothetical protein